MNTAKIYQDTYGNKRTIYQMVKCEPEWAANRIQAGEEAIAALKSERDLNMLCRRVLSMCKKRGWPLDWRGRGVDLHLESSELIESLRGKRGDPIQEAGDVLMVLMSITAAASIDFTHVMQKMEQKLSTLEVSDP